MNDTIFSLVTAPIKQNIAIIRISGIQAYELFNEAFNLKLKKEDRKIEYISLRDGNKLIDNVLVLKFVSPKSLTGEDLIEIQFHGSIFIVNEISNLLKKTGMRQSKKGEFMQRGFMNNKLNLIQAESINAILTTDNKDILNEARKNINEEIPNDLKTIIEHLEKVIIKIQVLIDYPENVDLKEYSPSEIKKDIEEINRNIDKQISIAKTQQKLDKGIRIAIKGIPNAGKSSLLNKILKKERVIVSPRQGTTTDFISETILYKGIKITFIDTAGIREKTTSDIERKGIEKALLITKEAEIIIFLFDITKNIEEQKQQLNYKNKNNIDLYNKKDLVNKNIEGSISIINNDLSEFYKKLDDCLSKFRIKENTFLISMNQIKQLETIKENINDVIENIQDENYFVTVNLDLQLILNSINKLIGKETELDYIYNLFGNLCLGK